MYAAPPVIETEVFARVPDSLRKSGVHSPWVDFRAKGSTPMDAPLEKMDSYLEGPSFDRQGNLYCVDIAYGRIFRVSPDGVFSVVVEYYGEPYSCKIHKDGRIFVADRLHGIMVLDPKTGKIGPFVQRSGMENFKGVNDMAFASNGDLYFTDPGNSSLTDPTGQVFRLRADGEVELILKNVPASNGLVLNPKETILYVAATRGNSVWRVPLLPGGGVMQNAKVGIFLQLSGSLSGPDGMAIDEQGNLAVCHSGNGCVWLFSRTGEPLYRIKSCTGGLRTTNCAYGGPDRKTLYITEAETGTIIKAQMPVPGRIMYAHM